MVGPVLAVVELDEEIAAVNPIVMRRPALYRAGPGEVHPIAPGGGNPRAPILSQIVRGLIDVDIDQPVEQRSLVVIHFRCGQAFVGGQSRRARR